MIIYSQIAQKISLNSNCFNFKVYSKRIALMKKNLPIISHFACYTHTNTHIYIRGSLNKFADFFCMGIFIDSTLMKL